MKRLFPFVLLLLAASAAVCQTTHIFPATDTNNNFTGSNVFSKIAPGFGSYAGMVATASPPSGMIWIQTDATAGTECTAGGGTAYAWCSFIGGNWVLISSGSGGGTTYPDITDEVGVVVTVAVPLEASGIIRSTNSSGAKGIGGDFGPAPAGAPGSRTDLAACSSGGWNIWGDTGSSGIKYCYNNSSAYSLVPSVTQLTMQNSSVTYGVVAGGEAGTFNFADCTVSGTAPSFVITCNGSASGISGTLNAGKVPKALSAHAVGDSTISDDGTNPTSLPDGITTGNKGMSFTSQPTNAASGTVASETACFDGSFNTTVCGISTTFGVLGVAGVGAGNSGHVDLCTTQCTVKFDGTSAIGNWAIPSTSTAGYLHDTGSTTLPTSAQAFLIDSVSGGAGSTAIVDVFTPYVAFGGGGGRAQIIKVNGGLSAIIANFNSTTPVAESNYVNVKTQASTTGGTTSSAAKLQPQLTRCSASSRASPAPISSYVRLPAEQAYRPARVLLSPTYLAVLLTQFSWATTPEPARLLHSRRGHLAARMDALGRQTRQPTTPRLMLGDVTRLPRRSPM
jgi:hypothetical protein